MSDYSFDFLFLGGGILGSSGAMALAQKLGDGSRVAVLDVDLEGGYSSTLNNAGGVRATWRNRANIELCSFSMSFYEGIKDIVQFRQKGYYWMHGESSWHEINHNLPIYKEYGLDIELFPPQSAPEILPFVDNSEGISGISLSHKAGLIDHYSLRELYRGKAREMGVEFFDRLWVEEVEVENGSVKGVVAGRITGDGSKNIDTSEVVKELLLGSEYEPEERVSFDCKTLINSTGAWSSRVSKLWGFSDDQVRPRRRQIAVVSCPELDLEQYGMIIDTSDIYFHKDAENILVGYSNMDEPYGFDFDFSFGGLDDESQFGRYIWIPLSKRISRFETLKLIRGWAGLYAETPDRSGYLGKVEGFNNLYESLGHTGRGLMISYGVGVALADLIVDGKFRPELEHAADLSRKRPSGELYEQLHL